jgi:hypothetical protein
MFMNRKHMMILSGALALAAALAAGFVLYVYLASPSVPEWVDTYVKEGSTPPPPGSAKQAAGTEVARRAGARPTAGGKLATSSAERTTPDDIESVLRENRRLSATNEKLQGQLVQILNWILANYKGKYPLPEKHFPKLKLAAVTEDYALNPDVAELLRITPEEEAMINDALAYAEAVVKIIEDESTTLASPNPDKVIVRIPAFPEEGAIVREDLYGALEITLGAHRFDRLMDVSEEELENSYHRFGDASRTIIFQLVYGDEDELPQLTIKDGWIIQEEDGTRLIQATESTVDVLPSEYADYADSLPQGIQMPVEQ